MKQSCFVFQSFFRYTSIIIFAFLFAAFISGCAVTEKAALYKLSPHQYPRFYDDMIYDGIEYSIEQSISYLKRVSPQRIFMFGKDEFDAGHMINSLEVFKNFIKTRPSRQALQEFIKKYYLIYQSIGSDKSGEVLFTGYYEPILNGSLRRCHDYRFPVYTVPKDLAIIDLSLFDLGLKCEEKIVGRFTDTQTVIPYYERKEISSDNLLAGRVRPLAWVDDLVDLFFLEIQGSGKIYLDTGQSINVHYHASNGRPYRSIGTLLIKEGKISKEQMSMQKIRVYLKDHPDEIHDILNYNQSYVFFKLENGGPYGCLAVELTPGRSLALQRRIFPAGALAFIETKIPLIEGGGQIHEWIDSSRFVLNQDTGGAIRGPGRADLFWGSGVYAKVAAGHMKHTGRLWFLILNPEIQAVPDLF